MALDLWDLANLWLMVACILLGFGKSGIAIVTYFIAVMWIVWATISRSKNKKKRRKK